MAKQKKTKDKIIVNDSPLSQNPFEFLNKKSPTANTVDETSKSANKQVISDDETTCKTPYNFDNAISLKKESKGRRGKTVTIIQGLRRSDLKSITKEIKKAMGCGAVVENGNIVVQGDLSQRLTDWFQSKGAKRVK